MGPGGELKHDLGCSLLIDYCPLSSHRLGTSKSNQRGNANTNLRISSTESSSSNIGVRDIVEMNTQVNKAKQVSDQKTLRQTMGYDPAENGAWQTASNYQNGVSAPRHGEVLLNT